MIKVTAVYRWREGATFNHDYYHSEHMRIARAALQPLGLVRRRILAPEAMRYVCLYSPTQRATSPAAEGFAEHLVKVLAKQQSH